MTLSFSEKGYSYYGMNNMYNAARIWETYVTVVQKGLVPGRDTYWWDTRKSFGFYNNDLSRSCYALSWMVADHTLQGLTNTYKVKDLILGYNSTIAMYLNEMKPN